MHTLMLPNMHFVGKHVIEGIELGGLYENDCAPFTDFGEG